MRKKDLPRHRKDYVWAHPYGHSPFSPVLYADGGAGDGGGSGSGSGDGGAGTGGDGGQGGAGAASGAAGAQGGAGDGAQDVQSLPPWAQKLISDTRAEAAGHRTAKQQAADDAKKAFAQEIGKVLGLVEDDKPADPAQLTATIGEQTGRIGSLEGTVKSLTVELAAFKAAGKHEANPAALLDSRSFLESVAGLDPAAEDFGTKLDAAIKAAVDGNQQLRAVPGAPRRGGGDFAGGPSTEGRPTSLGQAVAAALAGG
jgi:hypothetical protein